MMTAATTSRRAGNVLIILGLLITILTRLPIGASALSGELRAATPSALSVLLSQSVIDDKAEAFVIAADDAPADLAGVGAALGALPGDVSLLLTSPGVLEQAVATEIDRISGPGTVAFVIADEKIAAAVEARGLTVVLIVGATPTDIAVNLATATFGAPAGTGQRLIVTAGDLRAAGIANAHGANLGIPVVPVQRAYVGDVVLREILIVADPGVLKDDAVKDQPGAPVLQRVVATDLDALGIRLGELLANEPKDGDLLERAGLAVIALDDDELDPHPALLAAVAGASFALDGLDATVRVLPRAQSPDAAVFARLGLLGPEQSPTQTPGAPLPVTGGGLVLGALLVGAGAMVRRH
ncbi:MAG: hypothetical protein ACI867_000072 [Glaciecola sp.]|jgi:hypothetical protein